MTEDCTTCKYGKPFVGITFCEIDKKPMHIVIKCNYYKVKE